MLTKTTTIEIDDSAADWSLYSKTNANVVARELNVTITSVVNRGGTRAEVETAVLAKMDQYDEWGASDTEPRAHLADLLDRIFGEGR